MLLIRMAENRFKQTRSCLPCVVLGIIGFLSHRRLFNYLKRRHNNDQLGVLSKVLRARGRLNSITFNIKFLVDCLNNSVAPKSIQQRVRKSNAYHSAVIERSFVQDELAKCRMELLRARNKFYLVYKQAKGFLNWFDFIRFSWLVSEIDRKQRSSLIAKYDDSIKRLRQDRYGIHSNDYSTIINLTNIELTTLQKEVLCRGVDFGVPPKIREPEILTEFELLQRQVTDFSAISKSAAARSKSELAAIAQEIAGTKPDLREFSLKREHRNVLKDLRMNKALVIVRPDKGRATVLMTKEDYIRKMLTILDDESKFLRLGACDKHDRTMKIEETLQSFLKKLVDSKEITEETYAAICPVGSARPRMYGLPKVHKPGVPLRPILSMSSAPQYKVSQWLCSLLKPVTSYYGSHCVKDSFTFSDTVKSSNLPKNGFMCSFDVINLFTNVPLKEVIDICAKAIYHDEKIPTEPTSLSEIAFRKLLEMVTSGVEFSFDNVMYRQIDGVAMGSPLGPVLGNIFIGFYERKIPVGEWPELYHRFVDDIFSYFKNEEASAMFGTRLNSLHPALRFTREDEQDGSLPFMDVNVKRLTDGNVATSIYRKPTFTGLFTPWDSYSSTRYKVNLVRTLAHRARRICSTSALLDVELYSLKTILRRNGYPGHVLEKYLIPNALPDTPFIGPKRCPVIIRLPWLGSRSANFEQKISKAVRQAYFAVEVRMIYQTSRAFSLPKDVLPTPSLSNIVYQYECRHCGSRYVGKTSQHFSERIKQHVPKHLLAQDAPPIKRGRGRPPKQRQNAAESYQSAIACHLAASKPCRETFSNSDFTVLARARSRQHLNILEAVYIWLREPILCKQKSFVTTLQLF